jgi:DNA-binding CsgD family transcriptional regulator
VTQLERDLQALAARFARDVLTLVRRAPVSEIARVLGSKGRAEPRGSAEAWTARYGLTDAEAAILAAAVAGKTRAQVARSRGTSPETIKKQIHDLLAKTGDRSMLAATTRMLRERTG